MSFLTDTQTLNDLNIFGKRGSHSIYALFNATHTRGGGELLEQMFRNPLSDTSAIEGRIGIFRYFISLGEAFPFRGELFGVVEQYLSDADERSRLSQETNAAGRTFKAVIGADTVFKSIAKGVSSILEILLALRDFIDRNRTTARGGAYEVDLLEIGVLLQVAALQEVWKLVPVKKLSYAQVVEADRVLRYESRDQILRLLGYIYRLDVYMAVAGVAARRNFVFPAVLPKEKHAIELEGIYHPQLEKAVGSSVEISRDANVVFLTGANMAGKSTFMKSVGIAVLLAHMGFPVAAKRMAFSVRDGLLTTINLPDNLRMGYSHFYAEVMRIKKVAELLRNSRSLFVIFDELFRGTNVKDAYDATVALTAAFSKKPTCMFVISTHVIEAGEVLREQCDSILFRCLPTRMEGSRPVYSYTLTPGISADRHGMVIIDNERIVELIRGKKPTSIN